MLISNVQCLYCGRNAHLECLLHLVPKDRVILGKVGMQCEQNLCKVCLKCHHEQHKDGHSCCCAWNVEGVVANHRGIQYSPCTLVIGVTNSCTLDMLQNTTRWSVWRVLFRFVTKIRDRIASNAPR